MGSRHAADRYDFEEVHRSTIHKAPYNPRKITDEARKRLKDNLQRVGLTHPIVVNKRTGNVVSGHQRLSQLDAISKSNDYTLRVAFVDLDEQAEREQNVFENNPVAQGEWDFDQLESMFRDDHIDPDRSGFDPGDVVSMFGEDALIDQPAVMEELGTRIRELRERDAAIDEALTVDPDVDIGYYCVVIFPNAESRRAWTEQLGCGDETWIDSKVLQGQPVTSCSNHG